MVVCEYSYALFNQHKTENNSVSILKKHQCQVVLKHTHNNYSSNGPTSPALEPAGAWYFGLGCRSFHSPSDRLVCVSFLCSQ